MKHSILVVAYALFLCLPQIQSLAQQSESTVDRLMVDYASVEYYWEQFEIAEELIALGAHEVIPEIEKYLNTENRRRRCNAAFVLVGLGDRRGLSIIISELHDKSQRPIFFDEAPSLNRQIYSDRYYAALLLGLLGNREAVPDLIQETRDETIHFIAAISLGKIGDQRAIPALRRMLKEFPDQRLWAGYGLAALGDSQGIDILTDVMDSGSHWTERRHAVDSLGLLGDPSLATIIARALKDSHVNVRLKAAQTLGKLGNPSALPALTEALSDHEAPELAPSNTVESEARKAIQAIKEAQQ